MQSPAAPPLAERAPQPHNNQTMAYLTLFFTALGAATILPFYSEVVLLSMLYQGLSPTYLWLSATLGNTLGSLINWVMGRYLLHFQDRRWFPFKPAQLENAQRQFNRYGVWTLLFAWLPIGGDALTFIAGILRVNAVVFTVLVAIGKGARYGALIWLGTAF